MSPGKALVAVVLAAAALGAALMMLASSLDEARNRDCRAAGGHTERFGVGKRTAVLCLTDDDRVIRDYQDGGR